MKHANVAIFVPHAGCGHRCSFCDQRFISGKNSPPTPAQVCEIVESAAEKLSDSVKPAQIAFFGGSFTAMDKTYMVSLLKSVQQYLNTRNFSGIRISTRPDAINKDILNTLEKYSVTDIELGAQSMSDAVLQANLRGHSASDVERASYQIKAMGFRLGLQMMTGLYMDTTHTTQHTAQSIAMLKPDSVRIYPTVVLKGTMLAKLAESGEYRPQTLDEAVEECSGLLEFFTDSNIPVIKMGLHDSVDLAENIIAGPHHPAFRELCESGVMLRKAVREIVDKGIAKGKISLRVSRGGVSKMIGRRRSNIRALAEMGYEASVFIGDGTGYLQVEVF